MRRGGRTSRHRQEEDQNIHDVNDDEERCVMLVERCDIYIYNLCAKSLLMPQNRNPLYNACT